MSIWFGAKKCVLCVVRKSLCACVCLLCDGERWGCLVTTSSSWQWGEALGCQLFFLSKIACVSLTHTHTHTLIKITAAHLSKRWGNSHIRCDVHAAIFNTHAHTHTYTHTDPRQCSSMEKSPHFLLFLQTFIVHGISKRVLHFSRSLAHSH